MLATSHDQSFITVVICHQIQAEPTYQMTIVYIHLFSPTRMYKKLSYRRGTVRWVMSVEILPIDTQ